MKSFFYLIIFSGFMFFLWSSSSFSEEVAKPSDSLIANAPKIYFDCRFCDFDYLRREITFVNFVRDRKLADIHIIVTKRGTGSGGDEFTVEFIGQKRFDNMIDTLKVTTLESESDDQIRKALTRIFKQGLIRYVAKTPIANDISIAYSQPAQAQEVKDKWNYWVFKTELNSWINGEKSSRSFNLWGDFSASRVTEALKLNFGLSGSYNEDKYDYEDYKTLSIRRYKRGYGNVIFSLNTHWSTGLFYSISSSSFSNIKIRTSLSPAIEYNFFPYSESSQKQFTIDYYVEEEYVKYEEVTMFDKTEEWLTSGNLQTSLDLIQPWGSISMSLNGSHYFYDFKKNRLQLYGNVSLNIVKGFSFNIRGNVSRIHDQLSLRKGEANQEEVLLKQRELATSYSYWTSVGISYTFGSIYNNVVNPRFGD